MSKTAIQYQLPAQGGAFQKVNVPYPTPDADEVCIRAKAIGLNPLDWKSRLFGVMIQSWPTVLGVDVAGVVESVGESVKNFKVGDEVFGLCPLSARGGAYQEVPTLKAQLVTQKPATLSLEEAASLPVCFVTAAAAVTVGLQVPIPQLDPDSTSSLNTFLVLGGSSAVGAGSIQLLRIARPSATILTTASSKHHARLIALGADKCFERSVNASIIKAATPDQTGVDAILDAVGAAAAAPFIFDTFSPTGPKKYSQVMTGAEAKVPEGVSSTTVFGRQILATKGGINIMPVLASLIESGKLNVPTDVEVVGQGLNSIAPALERLQKGTSGLKLVVTL